jgi:L-ascorbate metabolism protein UlaG (beta-lactamase superfamily)
MSNVLTWYGHATLGLETNGCKILVDPFFSDNPSCETKADTVPADYILVSHGHSDHMGDTVPIAARTGATVITNFEVGTGWLAGVKKIHSSILAVGITTRWLSEADARHGSRFRMALAATR